jgi:tetratricopeptide (TPR) repeat protein
MGWLVLIALGAGLPLEEAQIRLLKGNYAEARAAFLELSKQSDHRGAAALGLSRAYEAEGDNDNALSAVVTAIQTQSHPDLLARHAELLYHRGDWDQAERIIADCLQQQDDHFHARWIRAQLWRDQGKYADADAEFRWFVRTYSARSRARQDIQDPELLVIVGQAGAENARWHHLSDQFRFILNEVYGDALKANRNYWPAEYHAGLLLLEKYNKKEALKAFDNALVINPRAADVLVGKGRLAMQSFTLAEAEALARRALEINPKHVEAQLLLADIAWIAGEFSIVEELLQQARAIRPRSESILARLAALEFIRSSGSDAEPALAAEVKKWNPKPGRFYFELAQKLDERKRFLAARTFYQKAIEAFPQLSVARSELGLLAMRLGDEEVARPLIKDAIKADPFHTRLRNSDIVLRHLDKYSTVRTEHFIIRFDPKQHAILGRILPDFLEAEYENLAKKYHHRPAGPFVFELFSNQEMFSGRIIAAPDLHTVGATTGRVFALTGPRAIGLKKPYNWARVIRHELTHIFNLDQTRFLVPHWLTEGLAVANEGFDRPAEWWRILADRSQRDQLFNLATIDAALTRPRSPDDWALAYCQAQIYVEYLQARCGPDVIAKLLQEYHEPVRTADIVRRTCNVELADIESGYVGYVRKLVNDNGAKPAERLRPLPQLEAAWNKNNSDIEIGALLADEYRKRKRLTDAAAIIKSVLEKDAQHPLAMAVKAQLLLDAGSENEAQELLESAVKSDECHPRTLLALGRIYNHAERFEDALELFERGRRREPVEPLWLEEISRSARQAGDIVKSLEAIQTFLRSNPDEQEQRRELARLAIEVGRFAIAEQAAREAIEIDPQDAEAQELLLETLGKQGKTEMQKKWQKYFDPGRAER